LVLSLVVLVMVAGTTWAAEKFTISSEEQAILDATNKEREKENLLPVKPNEKLFRAAREHSANMARQQKMEHILDEKTPVDRVRAAGYVHSQLGENIASGQRRPEDAVAAWMKSEAHKKTLLTKEYTEIGIGIAKDEKGKLYYTQVFATPRRR
jgi:uncharacterized protein YkwD